MKKKLECPVCGGRLVDREEGVKVELVVSTKTNKKIKPDFYVKCRKCGSEIIIRKLG